MPAAPLPPPGTLLDGLRVELRLGPRRLRVRDLDTGAVGVLVQVAPDCPARALVGHRLPGVLGVHQLLEGTGHGPLLLVDFAGAPPPAVVSEGAAAVLDGALAALHAAGRVHGRLDAGAVAWVADPAGGPPTPRLWPPLVPTAATAADDRAALARLVAGPAAAPAPPSAPDPAPPPGPAPRPPATGRALVVDVAGRGHCIGLQVALVPGAGQVWAPEGIARDAQLAAQVAVAVALGPAVGRWDLRWTVDDARVELHGSSVALALAVAADAALRGRPVPPGWAFSGGIELDGRVSPVAGLGPKLAAAAAAGVTAVGLPAAGAPAPPPGGPALPPDGPALHPVAHLAPLLARLHPPPGPMRRWWRLGLVLLPVAAALTALLAPLEAWVGHGLLRATRGLLPADDVAILAVDHPDPKALRADHPATLRALADAGVRAVVFDLALSTPSPHDAAIAAAVDALRQREIPVVLPVRFRVDGVDPPPSEIIENGALAGIVEARQDLLFGVVQATPLRRIGPDGTVWWHAAALAAAAAWRPAAPPTPRLAGDTLVIGPLQSPSWAGLLFWPPVAEPPVVPYGDTAAYGALADRVVFVGAWGGAEDVHRTPSGRAYGVEILAGATQTLLRQAGLRPVAPELGALAALGGGLGTALLAAALPRRRRGLALLVPAAVAAVGAALSIAGLRFAVLPVVLAALVGLWAEGHARRLATAPGGRPG